MGRTSLRAAADRQAPGGQEAMAKHYVGHEFEALLARFENQTELLYRLTLLDLRIFTGYITLQVAMGGWFATHQAALGTLSARVGILVLDLALFAVSVTFLRNNYLRRKEVAETVRNCSEALGYSKPGVYSVNALNAPTVFRPWAGWYFIGAVAALVGLCLVLLDLPKATE